MFFERSVRGALIYMRGAGWVGLCRTRRKPVHGARSPHPCGERSCKGPPIPPVRFPAGADGKGRIKDRSRKKAAIGCLFVSRCIHAWRGSTALAFAYPSAVGRPEVPGWQGCPGPFGAMGPRHASGGLGRTPNPGLAVCAGQRIRVRRHRAPWARALCSRNTASQAPERTAASGWAGPRSGVHGVPGHPCQPGPHHEAQRGNALNLTAPRKCPPRPCRCRCTSSPCRISAGDGAGRAAGSRYGSRRSRPAGGPKRLRRPAG